jgi:hypothetical protein
MERFVKCVCQRIAGMNLIILAVLFVSVTGIYAQEKQSITGKLIDRKGNQAVPFANVALIKASDSAVFRGTISDANGTFNLGSAPIGKYRLFVSVIGYKPVTQGIDVSNNGLLDAGTIYLQDTAILIKEMVVIGERVKAKSENGRTTFFMTKKILDASSTGSDVLKLIPGVQIDLMQNISLEGSRDIQIFVDGIQRDGSFINQLSPKQIEKVEVISKPSSNYDGNLTGAINIILKKERDSGINGQINAEIPTSGSEIFIRPAYTLNYGLKRLNLYTSYNGEMTYLDLHESTLRKVWNSKGTNEINSNQYVSQKNWSHRFNCGIDYFLNTHNQFNFYAYCHPYSRELDGNADSKISGNINNYWKAKKEDTDINVSTFYSMYYKHSFVKEGREITLDISDYNLKAKNSTDYIYEGSENSMVIQSNMVKPKQNEETIKIDYTTPIGTKLNLSTGVKTRFQQLQDRYLKNFNYNERIFAVYGNIGYKHIKYDLNLGLRAERSVSILKNNFRNPFSSFLPYTSIRYKINTRQNVQLSYSRSVRRPNIYELNPHTSIDDPYTISKGNPFLKPELRNSLVLEHSIQFKSNYFASRLIYNKMTGVISNLMFINDSGAFESQIQNMGTIHQFGIQFSGTLKLGIATLNPYLVIFEQCTSGNSLAKQHEVENRHDLEFDSGLSALLSFKHDISFSLVFQYASPKNDIQGNSYCDALYFLSLEKKIKQKIKIGIVSALPFSKSFIYQGSEFDGSDFYTHYKGIVKLSVPVWFKFCYQFNSGKNRERIERSKEEIDNLPKRGF